MKKEEHVLDPEYASTLVGAGISKLKLGEMQTFMNLSLVPVFSNSHEGPVYESLSEALRHGALTVDEISESGSVPVLKVTNEGEANVLIIDGEELEGAKQNRALNTSVLIRSGEKTTIPVSCTERGRWDYRTRSFYDSDVILSHKIRKKKMQSVSKSLKSMGEFASAQGEVWEEIDELHSDLNTHSSTSAMKDAYTARSSEIGEYAQAFKLVDGQVGVLVFLNGKITALEAVSCPKAFSHLHHKIVHSHAIAALAKPQTTNSFPDIKEAENFLCQLATSEATPHKSPGEGYDLRFSNEKFEGSALCVDDSLVHTLVYAE